MAKVRISTTVDEGLLARARECCGGVRDASVMEQALEALIAAHRGAEIDAQIDRAYREIPYDTPDDWGDLASWTAAAARGARASSEG